MLRRPMSGRDKCVCVCVVAAPQLAGWLGGIINKLLSKKHSFGPIFSRSKRSEISDPSPLPSLAFVGRGGSGNLTFRATKRGGLDKNQTDD